MMGSALIAGIIAGSVNASAQGPLYDKVVVDLPYSVTINDTVLQPGNYVIRQMDDGGSGSRVLMIFADNGMKLKATCDRPSHSVRTTRSPTSTSVACS